MNRAAHPVKQKRTDSNDTVRYVIVGFLLIYGLGQILLLLQSTGIFSSAPAETGTRRGGGGRGGRGGSSSSKADVASTDSSNDGASTVSGESRRNNNGGGAASSSSVLIQEIPFVYDQNEEVPFPQAKVDDGGLFIYDAIPQSLMDSADARQQFLDSRSKEDKEKGGKYDSTPVTVGIPCWTEAKLLWKMGLDAMAHDMEAGRVPKDVRRSRARHAYSDIISDVMCTFHSTPISGGLQCCCSSNMSSPYTIGRHGQEDKTTPVGGAGGTFFCLPSTVLVGGRSTGTGLLAAFFQQHAYLRYAKGPPAHVMSASKSLYVVDGAMPRYLAQYSSPSILPQGFSALSRAARPKAVSPWFWNDASPSYFYSINAPIMLRKLLPRSKVLVMIRDPVERAYADIVQSLARKTRKPAEAKLFNIMHACLKQVACTESSATFGVDGLTPETWSAGAGMRVEACILDGVTSNTEISETEGIASPASIVSCVTQGIRPGAVADWANLYKFYATASNSPSLLSCATLSGPALSAEGDMAEEGRAVWKNLVYSLRHQVSGCLESGDTPPTAVGAVVPVSEVEEILNLIKVAEERLTACSISVAPGSAIPVPIDLMAANVNGYELGLYAVAGEYPRDAGGPGRILLDGDNDGCFPDGVDVDDPAASLARSLYLRPLQRLHASYGRKVVQIYDTKTLRVDPSAVMDTIFESLSVYKPVLDPVQARSDCKLMGWIGEGAECNVRVPLMNDRVKEELTRVLEPYSRVFKAYLESKVGLAKGDE